jgi:hypothetical protein
MCQVVASVHAELKQSSKEDKIVSEYKIRLAADDPRNEQLQKYLRELNLEPPDVHLIHSQSIECCFVCSSVEHLMKLRINFESGAMKNVLQKIFTLLLNGDELIVIDDLKWDPENYSECVQQLSEHKSPG